MRNLVFEGKRPKRAFAAENICNRPDQRSGTGRTGRFVLKAGAVESLRKVPHILVATEGIDVGKPAQQFVGLGSQ